VGKYGLIYACAQKNAGPAGITIVIVRNDLLERSGDSLPGYLNYRLHAENNSLYNTPTTFGIYVVDLVAQWLLNEVGGLDAMYKLNQQKAQMLYEVIDQSDGFYRGHARPANRSLMNVTFRLASDELQTRFLEAADQNKLCSLKGHRSVGGIRASIYNAMPLEGVTALRDFMSEFKDQNQQ
jgi:phosphoserine aminotransferase